MAAPLIVLVNVDRKALQQTEALLSEAGYLVAAVASFDEATKLLDSVSPDLLVADVRLHERASNGLELVQRSAAARLSDTVQRVGRLLERVFAKGLGQHRITGGRRGRPKSDRRNPGRQSRTPCEAASR